MSQNAPKITILHGWAVDPQNQTKWQPLISELEKSGYECEFLLIPGLSAPLDEVWQLNDFVKWLETKLAGQERVILLGHSFGGQLSIRYTAQHPEQVQQLILIDSSGIRDNRPQAQVKRAVFMTAAKVGKTVFRGEVFRKILYKIAREHDYQQAPSTLRPTMANVVREQVLSDLPQLSCPTLIIWGENDRVTPSWMGKIFAEKISGSVLKIIKEARHSPQFTHVTEVVHSITEFTKMESPK
jgi:pimeloyl-ACP methyl ester carboxylesterase